MRRVWSVAALAAAFSMFASVDASGQAELLLGGGLTVPTGDFGDVANPGWVGFGGVTFPVGQDGLFVGAEGYYGSNGHDIEGTKSNIFGGNALIGVAFFNPGEVGPFVAAGAGVMSHQIKVETPASDFTDSAFALTGTAGFSFPLGTVNGSIAASFTRGFGDLEETMLAGISAAVGIPLGGGAL